MDTTQTAPRRILLVRLGAIGDVVMASGLLPALSSAYPKAQISWLTDTAHADLLRGNPFLYRLHLWPRRRWRELRESGKFGRFMREFRDLLSELRVEDYDLVVDLHGLLKGAVWARLAGGRRRIGLGSREGSGLLMNEIVSRKIDSALIGKEYRKLAEVLGAEPEQFRMNVVVEDRTRHRVANLLREFSVSGIYSVIAPFTTRPQKHWFDERWADLAHWLVHRGSVVMLGGPDDRENAETIERFANGHLVDLTGMTTLAESAAIIEQARVLVGVDTGLTHLGIAVNTPTVALFGSTRPYLTTGTSSAKVLYHPLACSPCRRHPTCDGAYNCMALHNVEDVHAAIRDVLGEMA